jgi:hypothetical protein
MKEIHRGLYAAQNGYGVRVLLGCDPPIWQVLISPLIKKVVFKFSKAAELGTA